MTVTAADQRAKVPFAELEERLGTALATVAYFTRHGCLPRRAKTFQPDDWYFVASYAPVDSPLRQHAQKRAAALDALFAEWLALLRYPRRNGVTAVAEAKVADLAGTFLQWHEVHSVALSGGSLEELARLKMAEAPGQFGDFARLALNQQFGSLALRRMARSAQTLAEWLTVYRAGAANSAIRQEAVEAITRLWASAEEWEAACSAMAGTTDPIRTTLVQRFSQFARTCQQWWRVALWSDEGDPLKVRAIDAQLELAETFEEAANICAVLPECYAGRNKVFDRVVAAAVTAGDLARSLFWVRSSASHCAQVFGKLIALDASLMEWGEALGQFDPDDVLYGEAIKLLAATIVIDE
ncbi:MAG: hypothetical protein A3J59_04935 [Candidatus Buchananbacteria bacterium RIFCSPHIGHO2_02_FULL_56_16]|uniref:Uncharacterized protein n=1 Tax=Candidatus Buchananbacteria bacterium RIFCSPHIGHO2_02_FULL_56_16 TaxID=1797542 RepID=A0A1G1YH20_9BACT|nr:MAG: hypothetical protein A3J59_04935 [Candidatus Buchananbacteria bacterium RIFCSPHIGHO2_02_FULL_56_16]